MGFNSDIKLKAWHIENLIESEPDAQVVLLCDALELENWYNISKYSDENNLLKIKELWSSIYSIFNMYPNVADDLKSNESLPEPSKKYSYEEQVQNVRRWIEGSAFVHELETMLGEYRDEVQKQKNYVETVDKRNKEQQVILDMFNDMFPEQMEQLRKALKNESSDK